MPRSLLILCNVICLLAVAGCASTPSNWCAQPFSRGQNFDADQPGAKTLFEWAVGKHDENGNDKNDKNGNGDVPAKTNGAKNGKAKEAEEEKPMPHDRPHVADSSQTVGLGRIMLESGYTFTRDSEQGAKIVSHSYPESVLRIGMFAEWLEVRLGWNYENEMQTANGVRQSASGSDDLDLGVRLAL